MEVFKLLELNIFAFVLLLLIYFNERRSKNGFFAYRIFMYLIKVNLILITVDSLTWIFNGKLGLLNIIGNWGSNILLYIFSIVPSVLWCFYADFQIFRDKKRLVKIEYVTYIFIAVNSLLSLISFFTGWYFYVDNNNVYHRGPYFWVHILLCYIMLLYTSIMILSNRKNIDKNYFKSLLLFPLPLLVGSIFQISFYGLSLNCSCMAISILIAYFNIQNSGLNTDYLTGVYNRRMLDDCLKEKIRSSTKDKTFAAVLIDLDKFKQINDSFGHQAGDEALQEVAQILRSCLENEDFIARYGGDEFYVIFDTTNRNKLNEVITRINKAAKSYNLHTKKPYTISFSMGYGIYDYRSKMKCDEFINYIDEQMYSEKKMKNSFV